jgi:hypothetical protein
MLIICSGVDSYRSLEKARDLEVAYKQKYDAGGQSIERLSTGKDGIDAFLSITSGASLFSKRRFIRADGIIKSCPKLKLEALIKMLSRDVEMTIIVSVEEGELKEKDIKDYKKLPKFFQYDFPLLSPPQFSKWAMEFATKNGLKDTRCIQELITYSQGNSWLFVNEFWKIRAGGEACGKASNVLNIFDVIDAFLQGRNDRWTVLKTFDDVQSVMAQLGNQVRSLVLVQANHTKGMHPFVAKKLSRMKAINASEQFQKFMTAFTWSRTGSASVDEAIEIQG